MSALQAVAWIVAALVALEAVVAGLVHWLKPTCPWLITERDLDPPIDRDGLDRFLQHGWDPELGWVRKPNTAHDEPGPLRTTRYHINSAGARANPGFDDRPPAVTVYGDSYGFARQVNDDETWTHVLSRSLGVNVANFAVGNFGADQALLRLEREYDHFPAQVVIMAVVPETIRRVHAVWKHFSEYGNLFAFKPRFELNGGDLSLKPNPVDAPEKFLHVRDFLSALKRDDHFFERMFRPDLLGFPYSVSLLFSAKRNLPLIGAAFADRLFGGERAFFRVMKRNIRMTADMYGEPDSLALLVAICRRFREFVAARGATPVLVIIPQLLDYREFGRGRRPYAALIDALAHDMTVIDVADAFETAPSLDPLFVQDRYGGHPSPAGNEMIARSLEPVLRPLIAETQPDAESQRRAAS